jgi:hypothetical protein
VSGDDNGADDGGSSSSTHDVSLKEEVSSEDEHAWQARSNDGDTTDSENDSIVNDVNMDTSDGGRDGNDGNDDDSDDQFSDDVFD